MAKKIESTLQNWDDVDKALKELGELNIKKTRLEGYQTLKINEIKAETEKMAGTLQTKIKKIEKNIERFTNARKDEFVDKRTKKLNFGEISYRLVKSFKINNEKNAIISLKTMNLDFCIDKKEKINKESLKECDTDLLEKAGISFKVEDKLKIEPNFEKLAALKED